MRMPVMNGHETTKAICGQKREDAGTVRLLTLLPMCFPRILGNAWTCGMNAHVAKPIDIRELVRMLGRYIYKEVARMCQGSVVSSFYQGRFLIKLTLNTFLLKCKLLLYFFVTALAVCHF